MTCQSYDPYTVTLRASSSIPKHNSQAAIKTWQAC